MVRIPGHRSFGWVPVLITPAILLSPHLDTSSAGGQFVVINLHQPFCIKPIGIINGSGKSHNTHLQGISSSSSYITKLPTRLESIIGTRNKVSIKTNRRRSKGCTCANLLHCEDDVGIIRHNSIPTSGLGTTWTSS